MPMFLIPITRDCTESTNVDIAAPDVQTAIALAEAATRNAAHEFTWVADECSGMQSDPKFVGDPADLEPVREIACGQCDGSGETDAMGEPEPCPVCDATGRIKEEAN